MEETKIWSIEDKSAISLNTTNQMETEGLLEDILTANPDMLEEGLQLVGRQTSTAGGPLDLLGVDTDGALVVFELKRGSLNRQAVAQIIDYASHLNAMDTDILSAHIEAQSGNNGIEKIDDFKDWYGKLRASNELQEEDLEALKPLRMVLVGLGFDNTTERMVNYMASGGMDISLLTFQGFKSDGKTLLSRNVEVERVNAAVSAPQKAQSRNRKAGFEQNAEALPENMRTVLGNAERMFRSQSARFIAGHSTTRMNFSLDFLWSAEHAWDDENRAKRRVVTFIEIDADKKRIDVGFHPVASEFAPEEFDNLEGEDIQYEKVQTQALWGTHEYKFPLYSLNDWEAQEDRLTALTNKVCEAYNAAKEAALSIQ